ncbi:MAG: hypothetical protein WBQ78_16605 [Gammaproteobacteria bacterium]
MKKIVLSVMAVVLAPRGDSGADRSTRAVANDPVTPAADGRVAMPGHAQRADRSCALHADEPVRLIRTQRVTVH